METKRDENSFKDFQLSDGTIIKVFQGSYGQQPDLDILIKYQQAGKPQMRIPKHVHWVVDILIKKQHDQKLTLEFVKYLRDMYDRTEPFKDKEEQQKCELKETTVDKLKYFESLNAFGEFSVEFIRTLIELKIREEKTGFKNAHVFRELLDAILREADTYTVISMADRKNKG